MRGSLKSMLVLFIVVAIALQLTGVWLLFFSSRNVSINTALEYQRRRMTDVCEALDAWLERKEQSALELTYDSQMETYIKATHAKRNETFSLMRKLLSNALLDETLTGARLAFSDGTRLSCGDYNILSNSLAANECFLFPSYQPLSRIDINAGTGMAKYWKLIYQVPILQNGYRQESAFRGALYLVFDMRALMARVFGDMPWALRLDDGIILYSDGFPFEAAENALAQERSEFRLGSERVYLQQARNARLGAQIVTCFDNALLTDGSAQYLRWALMLTTLIVACSAIVTIALYHSLLAPVAGVVRQLERIGAHQNQPSPPVENAACRELTVLTREINGMIERLHAHAKKDIRMQRELYDANLRHVTERTLYLQSQINPHFLYNNLECMRGMTLSGNGQKVRDMCTAMAEVYRYGTRGRKPTVTLAEELACLQRYEAIIRLRFGEQYAFQYDVPAPCLDWVLPRMTLQPLAENAVLHGLAAAACPQPRVRVAARLENGQKRLTLSDNGEGMTEEALSALNDELAACQPDALLDTAADRIGVINILCRLRLLLGAEANLRFEAAPGGGLCAVMTLGKDASA